MQPYMFVLLLLYFIPSVIAFSRGVLTTGFFLGNLFLGITGIGYIILAVIAFTKDKKDKK